VSFLSCADKSLTHDVFSDRFFPREIKPHCPVKIFQIPVLVQMV